MADIFDEVAEALDGLGAAIEAVTSEKREFVDLWGWNAPVLTKDEISEPLYDLSQRIRGLSADQRVDPYADWIKIAPAKIAKFQAQTVPQLPGGNASVVTSLLG